MYKRTCHKAQARSVAAHAQVSSTSTVAVGMERAKLCVSAVTLSVMTAAQQHILHDTCSISMTTLHVQFQSSSAAGAEVCPGSQLGQHTQQPGASAECRRTMRMTTTTRSVATAAPAFEALPAAALPSLLFITHHGGCTLGCSGCVSTRAGPRELDSRSGRPPETRPRAGRPAVSSGLRHCRPCTRPC